MNIATEWTWQKRSMTGVTLPFFTWKWCMTYHPFTRICAIYKANLWNRLWAMEQTWQKLQITHVVTLTFWPWNGAQNIIPSQVVFVPHMKWKGPIRVIQLWRSTRHSRLLHRRDSYRAEQLHSDRPGWGQNSMSAPSTYDQLWLPVFYIARFI